MMPSPIEECCRRRPRRLQGGYASDSSLLQAGVEAKGHDDPSFPHAQPAEHEGFICKRGQHAIHVVLDVFPVIRQVRIAASASGRETNLQPRPIRAYAKLGPDRGLCLVLKEWTLELAHKEIRKLTHEDLRGSPAPDVPAEDQESQRRDDDGGAEPYVGRVDIQARSQGDRRSKEILDHSRTIGRGWTGGWFGWSRRLVGHHLTCL